MPKELQIFQQKDTCVISVQTDNRGEVGDVGMLRQYAEEVGSQFSLQWMDGWMLTSIHGSQLLSRDMKSLQIYYHN